MRRTIVNGGHDLRTPSGTQDIDVKALEGELERGVRGEVRFDAAYRAIYSHDSSNYRQAPIGVVVPADQDDVVAAIAACRAHGAPVLPRGCGTSLSGETANHAVVIDTSRNLRAIKEVNADERYAVVEPGVIHDQLTDFTEQDLKLTFAPDTSTHAWATFGGMIGNNSCGVHSVMGGRTSDNIHELDIVTYDGCRMRVGETSDEELERIIATGGRRGEIFRRMRTLRDRYADHIREGYPQIPRRVSGYNLDDLLPEKGFHVGRALTGSEGTLATVLEAKVRLLHSPPQRSLLVVGYPEHAAAAEDVPALLEAGAIGLEAIDHKLLSDLEVRRESLQAMSLLPSGKAFLLVEFGGESAQEAEDGALKGLKAISRRRGDDTVEVLADDKPQQSIWEIRENGLGATSYVPMEPDHWPGWEDAAVAPEKVAPYLRDFDELLDRYGYRAALYGHYGDGCIHCRINFDLRTDGGVRKWRSFLDEAADLVVAYGGSLSGEHGDGQQRAELLEKMYGAELVKAMEQFKAIWDPENRMNPHKVVDPYPIVSNMKLGAGYHPSQPEPLYFSYPEDGGSFAHAALRCVGAGACRDTSEGTMCPSYMVTLDEEHTTRGRARILYEMLEGDTITDGFKSDDVHEALDLCLSCKGCKGDCPVSVDMATYKAEFLSKYFKGRLRPPEAYSMGLIMVHARLAARMPRVANALMQAPLIGAAIKRAGGISPERAMPPFAPQPFQSWFERRGAVNPNGDPVVLFPDTFNNFLHPEPMKATVEVLEAAGFRVVVPEQPVCCGRPLYDYGMLPTARRFLQRLVDVLGPHVRAGTHIVGVEPSCIAVFRDELVSILPHDEDAKRISKHTLTLAEFLQQHAQDWDVPRLDRRALVHGHCHQEAVMGMSAEQRLYERMGLDAEVLDSGCCGMAGSFGFEAGHYDISVKIGEHKLLPIVREAPAETLLIADGFSCKTQVEQLTDRRPLHTAQVIKMAMDHGPEGVAGPCPEQRYPDVHVDGHADGRMPAIVGASAALAAGAAGAAIAARRRS
jgi:FAD/FMN-containing dehydrogenase/Fe-S oxidoreductase